ncbi:hypothetical protein ACEPAF_8383 [Sanghuangporus sanghuang]
MEEMAANSSATLEQFSLESNGFIASTPLYDGAENYLSRVLSKLGHLDLSGKLLDKNAVMEANGGYCDVFIGYISPGYIRHRLPLNMKDSEVKVAVKRLRFRLNRDKKLAKTLAREIAVWSKLNHPNILPLLGYMFEKDYPSLISEWMKYGTMRDFLKNHPSCSIAYLSSGIAAGLKYIHDRNIVHSDMKTDNILIGEYWQPVICDFGISRMLDSSQSIFVSTTHDGQTKGSARWMAIELFVSDDGAEVKHTKETDIWAFGMTLYEMITKQFPYAHLKRDVQVLSAVMKGDLPLFPRTRSKYLSSNSYWKIRSLCSSCWVKNPKERPTTNQITLSLSSLWVDELRTESRNRHVEIRPRGAGGPNQGSEMVGITV